MFARSSDNFYCLCALSPHYNTILLGSNSIIHCYYPTVPVSRRSDPILLQNRWPKDLPWTDPKYRAHKLLWAHSVHPWEYMKTKAFVHLKDVILHCMQVLFMASMGISFQHYMAALFFTLVIISIKPVTQILEKMNAKFAQFSLKIQKSIVKFPKNLI